MAFYRLANPGRRFIFCVDPKCGCTTIKVWFAKTLGEPVDPNRLAPAGYMISADEVRAASDFTRVWFVRDPMRRLVSFYYQFVAYRSVHWCFADHDEQVRLEGATFASFLHSLHDLWVRGEPLQHHLKPQTREFNTATFDRIIKIEELDERANELMALLDIDIPPGHENRRHHHQGAYHSGAEHLAPDELTRMPVLDYESFWSNELRAMAREAYADDCRLYDSL